MVFKIIWLIDNIWFSIQVNSLFLGRCIKILENFISNEYFCQHILCTSCEIALDGCQQSHVNIGSDNGLVSFVFSLPDTVLIQIYVIIIGHNELMHNGVNICKESPSCCNHLLTPLGFLLFVWLGHVAPGGHYWHYYTGNVSSLQVTPTHLKIRWWEKERKSTDSQPIFKIVAVTWLNDRVQAQ